MGKTHEVEVFILGLSRSIRSKNLLEDITSRGHKASFFEGEDLRFSELSSFQKYQNERLYWLDRDLSGGEIGCALSHYKIIQSISQKKIPLALILEDDALLNEDFDGWIFHLIEYLSTKKTPLIIPLFYSNLTVNRFGRKKFAKLADKKFLIQPSRPTYGTVGYLLNLSAADVISNTPQKFVSTADWPAEWQSRVTFLVPSKKLLTHSGELNSLIDEGRVLSQRFGNVRNRNRNFGLISDYLSQLKNLYRIAYFFEEYSPNKLFYFKTMELLQYRFPTSFRFFYKRIDLPGDLSWISSIKKITRAHKYAYWMLIRPVLLKRFATWFRSVVGRIRILGRLTRLDYIYRKFIKKGDNLSASIRKDSIEILKLVETKLNPIQSEYLFETGEVPATFALVVTIFNQSRDELQRCLHGIEAQKLYPNEVIWIDGGSTNSETKLWFHELKNKGFNIEKIFSENMSIKFFTIPNIGICKTRNFALNLAESRYIVFHDPDDELGENFFSNLNKVAVRNLSAQVIYPNAIIRNPVGKQINYWETGPFEAGQLIVANRIPATSCVDRAFLICLGGFRESMELGMEDWDLWVRASIAGAVGIHAPEAEYYYTENHPTGRSIQLSAHEEEQRRKVLIYARTLLLKKLGNVVNK